jgi:hypothetical protein
VLDLPASNIQRTPRQLQPAMCHTLCRIERIISLLSASPVGEARLPMPKGMAYKDLLLLLLLLLLLCRTHCVRGRGVHSTIAASMYNC